MDIHPVAVIIARVTYLLALAPVIARRAGSLSIPVYLGDAMQLSTATTMHLKELVIRVPPPPEGARTSSFRKSSARTFIFSTSWSRACGRARNRK